MERETLILNDYDYNLKGYSITNPFGELTKCITFEVEHYDFDLLKEKITESVEITEHGKAELFEDWNYVTRTKLERNGGYFFNQ
jgi:hypothetical protein